MQRCVRRGLHSVLEQGDNFERSDGNVTGVQHKKNLQRPISTMHRWEDFVLRLRDVG